MGFENLKYPKISLEALRINFDKVVINPELLDSIVTIHSMLTGFWIKFEILSMGLSRAQKEIS